MLLTGTTNPVLPPWVVLPAAAATMLVVAAHILVMPTIEMPASRRRIRTVNGFLMLFATALLAYAFGMATESAPRRFAVVWSAVVLLLAVIVAIAMLDVLNTVRLGFRDRRRMREGLRDDLHAALARRAGSGAPSRRDQPAPGDEPHGRR
jgi:4-amino-4-deoxy-L-arabinose transferase-like glycosyltransferase